MIEIKISINDHELLNSSFDDNLRELENDIKRLVNDVSVNYKKNYCGKYSNYFTSKLFEYTIYNK